MSDHGIVWFDIWFKCKLYCVPSLKVYHSGVGHPVFSVLIFNLLLKSLIFSRKSFWSSYLVPRNGEKAGFYIYPRASETPCRKTASSRRVRVTSDPLSDLRTHHFGLATPQFFTKIPPLEVGGPEISQFLVSSPYRCYFWYKDWPSSSWEVDVNGRWKTYVGRHKTHVARRRTPIHSNIFPVSLSSPLWKGRGPSNEQTWIPFNQKCFVPSLVEIRPVHLENLSIQFCYSVIISPLKMTSPFIWINFPTDDLRQVWLKLVNFINVLFTISLLSPLGKKVWPFIDPT